MVALIRMHIMLDRVKTPAATLGSICSLTRVRIARHHLTLPTQLPLQSCEYISRRDLQRLLTTKGYLTEDQSPAANDAATCIVELPHVPHIACCRV